MMMFTTPPHLWLVAIPGEAEPMKVHAQTFEVLDNGTLIFRWEGAVTKAFAPGQWLNFCDTGRSKLDGEG
jgi:hypothetical protein